VLALNTFLTTPGGLKTVPAVEHLFDISSVLNLYVVLEATQTELISFEMAS
jgi:hypothetical protein